MSESALSKSKNLLKEVIGDTDFRKFEAAMSIQISDPNDNIYAITRVRHGVSIRRHRQGESKWGEIRRLGGHELYDSVATLAMAIKLGKVDWQCGDLSIHLPQQMPNEAQIRQRQESNHDAALRRRGIRLYTPEERELNRTTSTTPDFRYGMLSIIVASFSMFIPPMLGIRDGWLHLVVFLGVNVLGTLPSIWDAMNTRRDKRRKEAFYALRENRGFE